MFSRFVALPFALVALIASGCIIVPGSSSLLTPDYGRSIDRTGAFDAPTPTPTPAVSRDATIPIIASLTASPTNLTQPGQEVVFHIEAVDASGTPSYTWSATGGTLTSTAGTRVAWRSPASPGRYTVLVLVSSASGGATTGAINIEVNRDGTAAVLETAPDPSPSPTPAATPSVCAVTQNH